MGKIVITEFISLDGVVESPEKWSINYWNDGIAQFKNDELFASDAMLLGRVTYEAFASAWPGRAGSDEFADRMNALPKFVASRTITDPTWNATILDSSTDKNLVAAIKRAAASVTGDVLVGGSASLSGFLICNRLVDEIRLLTYPVTLGSGLRLFNDKTTGSTFELANTQTFDSVVATTYTPKR